MKSLSWWDKPIEQLEREISRLQGILKHRNQYSHKTVVDAARRVPLLKAILAARRAQMPLFPHKGE